MKKIYSAPLTEVVKINAESLCVVSEVTLSSTKYNGSLDIESKEDDEYFDGNLW